MARRAHVYPQVVVRAADLIDGAVVAASSGVAVADALRLAERRHAVAVACGRGRWVLREDLARARALGLGELDAAALARPLPVLSSRAGELEVRRKLAAGPGPVVVADGGGAHGVVAAAAAPRTRPLARALETACDAVARRHLGAIARAAATVGARAFLVGGVVREVLLGRAPGRDLDVAVEGDGPAAARALATALGGTLVEHERFLTASVTALDGRRIDVVTARSERYETPGALPRVLPASLAQDLRRRDFAVNAMAVDLQTADALLLDPLGGAADLAAHRLRVLHPLSFVEDPTRIFRLARYAARLGFVPDPWTRRCQALALTLAPYPALSGQRIAAELEKIAADANPDVALTHLARSGALRLLDARYRLTSAAVAALAALPDALAWSASRALAAAPRELALLAALAGQPSNVARASLERLALRGEPLERVLGALARGRELAATAAHATTPSALAAHLRDSDPLLIAFAWLVGEPAARAAIDRHAASARTGTAPDALDGDDVIRLGVPRGPAVAEVLAALRDRRLDREIANRAGEIDYVRAWVVARRRDSERQG